jgi:predicted PurR-regulated permease PerM
MQKLDITTGSWIRAIVVLIITLALFQVGHLLVLIVASVVIASAIEPITLKMTGRRVPRLLSVVLIYVSIAALFAGLFYFLFLPLLVEMSIFIRTFSIYLNATSNGGVLSNLFEKPNTFGNLQQSLPISELTGYVNSLTNFLSKGILSSASKVFGGALSFILTVVLSFYLSVQEDGVAKFLRLITPTKHERYVIGLWKRSQRKIGLWLQGQIVASSLVMILVYFGLLIAGVPHALPLAVLAGVFDLIPIIGPIFASVPAIFVGLADGGLSTALVVAVIYLIVQQFENHVIFPIVHKKLVGVPPMVSILSIAVGWQLAGFLGVVISVPVAAAVMEFFSDVEGRKAAELSELESQSQKVAE